MAIATYENGCPRIGWCIACQCFIALRADGVLVPHQKRRGRGACHSDYDQDRKPAERQDDATEKNRA